MIHKFVFLLAVARGQAGEVVNIPTSERHLTDYSDKGKYETYPRVSRSLGSQPFSNKKSTISVPEQKYAAARSRLKPTNLTLSVAISTTETKTVY